MYDLEDDGFITITTPVAGIDYTWIPDLNFATSHFDFNYIILMMVTRNGHAEFRTVKVKTNYKMENMDFETEHLTVLQHLSVNLSLVIFPSIVSVLCVWPLGYRKRSAA